MSRYRLIKAFENHTVLPVDLNAVRSWLIDKRIQDDIQFIGVELEPQNAIRGFVKRFHRHKGGWDIEPDQVSNIFFEKRQPSEWQNITCAKELLHILDAACVTTREAFRNLTQRLTLPNDIRHLLEDPDFALVDKMGTAPACALLLPLTARNLLLPAYKNGILTATDIARQAVMPVEHVRTVMSEEWPLIYEVLKKDNLVHVEHSDTKADTA